MSGLRAFTMPKWGIEMTEGTIGQWMLAEGASFARGEVLTLIETDKITNEYEAEHDGLMARILVKEGETRPVGALLAVFADAGTSPDSASIDNFIAGFRPAGAAAEAPSPTAPAPAATAPAAPATAIPPDMAISPAARTLAQAQAVDVSRLTGSGREGRITYQDVAQALAPPPPPRGTAPVDIQPRSTALDHVHASPLARRIAVQQGIDLSGITGTGPRGRICKADVLALTRPAAPPARPDVEVVAMSPMRKAIARQLSLSKSSIPHFYLRNTVRVDALMAMRARAKQATGEAPSLNDYLIRACALALAAHPDVNIQVHGDEIHRFAEADIAVAVATDKGLLTPIIRGAQAKSVAAISAEMKALAARARAGRLAAEEFQGGSFSLSNLGMFGIEQFDAIINPPQGAILAVGAARPQTTSLDHALAFVTTLSLSLSCDHRAIDGAVGAKFLAELSRLIETPEALTR